MNQASSTTNSLFASKTSPLRNIDKPTTNENKTSSSIFGNKENFGDNKENNIFLSFSMGGGKDKSNPDKKVEFGIFGKNNQSIFENEKAKNTLFSNKNPFNKENNKKESSLFGSFQESSSLFGNNNNKHRALFDDIQTTSTLFGNINQGNSIFPSTGSIEKAMKNRNNKDKINNKLIKCNHDDKYCAFCIEGEINFICYECIYEYNLDKEKCIPIYNDLNSYVNIYNEYIIKIKQLISDEILKEISKLELDKNGTFYSIAEKIDLKLNLPIEVSFEERLKIGVKRKISNILKNISSAGFWLFNNYINLNLYKTKLKNIKTKFLNPYENEIITLKSEIPFFLKGISIPKISEFQDNIEFSFKKKQTSESLFNHSEENKIKVDLKENEEKNLTSIIFENPIYIEKNFKYEITISGIKGINYIDNEEEFSTHSSLSFESNNENSIIASLII